MMIKDAAALRRLTRRFWAGLGAGTAGAALLSATPWLAGGQDLQAGVHAAACVFNGAMAGAAFALAMGGLRKPGMGFFGAFIGGMLGKMVVSAGAIALAAAFLPGVELLPLAGVFFAGYFGALFWEVACLLQANRLVDARPQPRNDAP